MPRIIRSWKSLLAAAVFFMVGCSGTPTESTNTGSAAANTNVTSTPKPTNAADGEIQIGSPTPTLSPLPPDADGVRSAIAVVQEYYSALRAGDYRTAYELWSGNGEASGQSFEEFRDGFADTVSTQIDTGGEPGEIEGAAGSQYVAIPGVITSRTSDGKTQKFWGEYVLRRSMVDGASPEQRSWRIHSAKFRKL